jgi:hypothetical protein
MKIWHGYGSEHSMNLVMIGKFKNAEDAKKTKKLIDQLTEGLDGKIEVGSFRDRYGDDVLDLLRKLNCHILGPTELEQFLYAIDTEVEGDTIVLTTDETEVSAFFKLMIQEGARVEIFSRHHYPNAEYSQGK